jgi:alpha-tubulin suppressor-like RCC1 family protein
MAAVSAVAISAGTYHTCAVATGGGLLCWGGGYSGQLGIGNFVDQVNPVGVDLGSGIEL